MAAIWDIVLVHLLSLLNHWQDGNTQPVSIIIHLMHHEGYSFYSLKDGLRKEVYHKSSVDGKAILTIDPYRSLVDSLKFLPEC